MNYKVSCKINGWYLRGVSSLWLLVFSLQLSAQRDVEVSIDFDNTSRVYNVYATNNTSGTITLLLDIAGRINLKSSGSLPLLIDLKLLSSRHNIMTMSARDNTQSFSFDSYSWKYAPGCIRPRIDPSVSYLIPVKDGQKVKVKKVSYLGSMMGKEEPENWSPYSFIMEPYDTVYAARRGRVIKAEEGYTDDRGALFTENRNSMLIEHEGCTYGSYSNFVLNGIFPNVNDFVEAGDPIGMIGERSLTFNVYTRINTRESLASKAESTVYFPYSFATKEKNPVFLKSETSYTADHSDDLITQDMSKREIKIWLKSKSTD